MWSSDMYNAWVKVNPKGEVFSPKKNECCSNMSSSPLKALLSPNLGITKEIMSRGPQVLDMEYWEPDRLEHGPGGPIFSLFQRLHFVISNNNIHHFRLGPTSEMVLAPWVNESEYHGMCYSDPHDLWICEFNSFVSDRCLDLMLVHLTMSGGNHRMP